MKNKVFIPMLPLLLVGCTTAFRVQEDTTRDKQDTSYYQEGVSEQSAGYYEDVLTGKAISEVETAPYESVDAVFKSEEGYPLPSESSDAESLKKVLNDGTFSQIDNIDLTGQNLDLSALNELVINFQYDSHDLSDEMKEQVTKHAVLLKKVSNLKVILEGHTDSRGDRAYNLKLGEQRAITVRDYLSDVYGIEPSRVELISFGEERLVSDGLTENDHQKNRRAEFKYK